MLQTAHQGAFTVLKARSNFGERYVAILEVGVAIADFGDWTSSLKVQRPVFSDCFHWQKRDRCVLGRQQVCAYRGIDVGDISQAGLCPSLQATTPFINSRNRFSISRISSAMTCGLRGAL